MKYENKTCSRTLDLFEAFQFAQKPLTLSELARLISAPTSSCHGLLRTLRNRGYLYSVAGGRMLYPTKRLLNVATVIAAHDPILDELGPLLVSLRDQTGETVILGKLAQNAVVYVEVVEGLHTIRYTARPGDLKPLHSSSIGKAMLSELSSTEMNNLLKSIKLQKMTSRTITDPSELAADLLAGKKRGYFVTRGENVEDVMAIAAIIRKDSDLFSIAIAGPLSRVNSNVDRYAKCLMQICRQPDGVLSIDINKRETRLC